MVLLEVYFLLVWGSCFYQRWHVFCCYHFMFFLNPALKSTKTKIMTFLYILRTVADRLIIYNFFNLAGKEALRDNVEICICGWVSVQEINEVWNFEKISANDVSHSKKLLRSRMQYFILSLLFWILINRELYQICFLELFFQSRTMKFLWMCWLKI